MHTACSQALCSHAGCVAPALLHFICWKQRERCFLQHRLLFFNMLQLRGITLITVKAALLLGTGVMTVFHCNTPPEVLCFIALRSRGTQASPAQQMPTQAAPSQLQPQQCLRMAMSPTAARQDEVEEFSWPKAGVN